MTNTSQLRRSSSVLNCCVVRTMPSGFGCHVSVMMTSRFIPLEIGRANDSSVEIPLFIAVFIHKVNNQSFVQFERPLSLKGFIYHQVPSVRAPRLRGSLRRIVVVYRIVSARAFAYLANRFRTHR